MKKAMGKSSLPVMHHALDFLFFNFFLMLVHVFFLNMTPALAILRLRDLFWMVNENVTIFNSKVVEVVTNLQLF